MPFVACLNGKIPLQHPTQASPPPGSLPRLLEHLEVPSSLSELGLFQLIISTPVYSVSEDGSLHSRGARPSYGAQSSLLADFVLGVWHLLWGR